MMACVTPLHYGCKQSENGRKSSLSVWSGPFMGAVCTSGSRNLCMCVGKSDRRSRTPSALPNIFSEVLCSYLASLGSHSGFFPCLELKSRQRGSRSSCICLNPAFVSPHWSGWCLHRTVQTSTRHNWFRNENRLHCWYRAIHGCFLTKSLKEAECHGLPGDGIFRPAVNLNLGWI